MKLKSVELDLTQGSVLKNVLIFTVPLILTNLLQALFTMVDASIVGKFSGSFALGSVGSTQMMIFFFNGFIVGIAAGVNVITAYYVGAKNKKEVSETLFTSFVVCIVSGVLLMFLSISCARLMLLLLKTKEELLEGSLIYFRLYMLGLPFVAVYNFGNAILRSVGDTKRSMYYLMIAGVANVLLDLLFVIVFKWSVAGVALASVVSQIISAVFIFIAVIHGTDIAKLTFKNQHINRRKAIQILKIGLPAGLQSSVFAFANMFIQSGVNSFDAVTVSGITAADKADAVVYNAADAFYTACACFIGQNYGAQKKNRILKSYFVCLMYSFLTMISLGTLFFIFGNSFISLFTNDLDVVQKGLVRLRVMAFSYCLAPFMDNSLAASRGLGKTSIPTVIVILGSCVFRIFWIYTVFPLFKTIESLFILFPVSWIITATAEIFYFSRIYKKCLSNI